MVQGQWALYSVGVFYLIPVYSPTPAPGLPRVLFGHYEYTLNICDAEINYLLPFHCGNGINQSSVTTGPLVVKYSQGTARMDPPWCRKCGYDRSGSYTNINE